MFVLDGTCLLDEGVGVTVYTLKKDSDLPANYHCTSSTLTYFIQYYTILPNLADQMIHLGVPVNNIDPEPYPKDSVLDCLGICLSVCFQELDQAGLGNNAFF